MRKKIQSMMIAVPLALFTQAGLAGDPAAGQAKFSAVCEACHFPDDFSGEAEADIAAMITAVNSGETEHEEELSLTPEEIADLAAFYASQ